MLRVMSFNVAGGRQFAQLLGPLLDEWQADIVAFQECGGDLVDAVRRLPRWYHHDDNQLCLVSRYPILEGKPLQRRNLDVVEESGLGGSSRVVRYAIDAPWRTIFVSNLHLETPRKGLEGMDQADLGRLAANAQLREVESRLARAWVARAQGPAIVMGDFNMPVESPLYRESWSGYENAFSAVGRGFGMTRDNGWIKVRIDHVLADRAWWRAERAYVGTDMGSDHRPVFAELRFVGQR